MDTTVLEGTVRTEFGKGAARRIRREHKIPAVIYGHGMDPVHVSLPGHETMMAVKVKNALLQIKVEDGTEHLVVVKSVTREIVRRFIEHVDLLVVREGERIVVEVPIRLVGEAGPDSLVTVEATTIALKAEATHLPEEVVVDIAGKPAGTIITAADVSLPEGSKLKDESDFVLVNISHRAAKEEEPAEADAEGDAPAADAASAE